MILAPWGAVLALLVERPRAIDRLGDRRALGGVDLQTAKWVRRSGSSPTSAPFGEARALIPSDGTFDGRHRLRPIEGATGAQRDRSSSRCDLVPDPPATLELIVVGALLRL